MTNASLRANARTQVAISKDSFKRLAPDITE
jgi:hypothetical protein